MKLNPADITHQEFNRALRGFNTDEVSAFLEVVSENYTELADETRALIQKLKLAEQENEQLRAKLQENEKTAKEQKNELLKIERLMDTKIDADFMTQRADAEAEKIIAEARKKADQILSEIKFLEEQKSKIAAYVRDYLRSQLTLLEIVEDGETLPVSSGTTFSQPLGGDTAEQTGSLEAELRASRTSEEEVPADGIQSFLKDISLDDIPPELAEEIKKDIALHALSTSDSPGEKKKKVLEDLDRLMKNATGMFKKSDFNKMLGEDASKKAEEMINQIYDELEKKKTKPNT